jgi:hypothetical protein
MRVSIVSYYFGTKSSPEYHINCSSFHSNNDVSIHPPTSHLISSILPATQRQPRRPALEQRSTHLATRQHLRRPAAMPKRQRRPTAPTLMHDVLEEAHHIRDTAQAADDTSDSGHGTLRMSALVPLRISVFNANGARGLGNATYCV